jgi:flagellar basal body-associated protein FliL
MLDFNKKEAWILISIVLAILFLATLTYILVGKYKEAKEAEKAEILKIGTQQGYEYAVNQIVQQSSNCQPVAVFANNISMQLVDFDCIKNLSKSK